VNQLNHKNIVGFIEDIFDRRGADSYLGETVTMSQHMLQCARYAENAGAQNDLISAALLHDIGHYTSEFPEDALEKGTNNFHETAGARVLGAFFPPLVVDCVRYHVEAKRYLCAARPGYYDQLSDASKHTLKLQGGPFTSAEAEQFSTLEFADEIVKVRIWDDLGKDPKQTTPAFSHYRPILQSVVDQHSAC